MIIIYCNDYINISQIISTCLHQSSSNWRQHGPSSGTWWLRTMNLAAKHRFGFRFVSSSYGRGSSAGLAWAGFGCRTLSWRPGHTWFPRHDQTWLKQNWQNWSKLANGCIVNIPSCSKIVRQRFGCCMLPLHLVKSFTTLEHTWALFLKAKAAEASSARSHADVESAPAITILRLQWNSKTCGDRKPNWRPKNIQKHPKTTSAI